MFAKKLTILTAAVLLFLGIVVCGCEDDSNYDQRTVIYVSNINDGLPFMSDVLDQGDSLYYTDSPVYKLIDDYIAEDVIKIEFHNRPYNSQINAAGSLGDFLVTSYRVEFVRIGAGPRPVEVFTGEMNLLVPANTMVEAFITLVPFYNKAPGTILSGLRYSDIEIMTNAHIIFRGHEVQTDREIEFSAGLFVEFADPLQIE